MRILLLIACLACAAASASAAHRPRPLTVTGQVVAYSSSLLPMCLNGNKYWSMIIRGEKPKKVHSKFIKVDFSLPCGAKDPDWVSATPPTEKFRLVRDKDGDAVLREFIKVKQVDEDGRTLPTAEPDHVPMWDRPPGVRDYVLPFGQVVPRYQSLDLPLTPVL